MILTNISTVILIKYHSIQALRKEKYTTSVESYDELVVHVSKGMSITARASRRQYKLSMVRILWTLSRPRLRENRLKLLFFI